MFNRMPPELPTIKNHEDDFTIDHETIEKCLVDSFRTLMGRYGGLPLNTESPGIAHSVYTLFSNRVIGQFKAHVIASEQAVNILDKLFFIQSEDINYLEHLIEFKNIFFLMYGMTETKLQQLIHYMDVSLRITHPSAYDSRKTSNFDKSMFILEESVYSQYNSGDLPSLLYYNDWLIPVILMNVFFTTHVLAQIIK